MKGRFLPVFVCLFLLSKVSSSAIPIWEMLTYEEKMGRLMYTFVHLVERYCKTSSAPDCRKVMTMHGISNLLNYDEQTLDLLDPDQRNGSELVWQAATKSKFKYPADKNQDQEAVKLPPAFSSGDHYETADSKDEPQRVIVAAPKFLQRRYWRL